MDILKETDATLTGKLAIVTGATSGLGKETVRSLVSVGCRVIMAARNYDKAIRVKQEKIGSVMNEKTNKRNHEQLTKLLIPMILDLASFQSVFDFATKVHIEYQEPLDYLFNNAGIMAVPDYTVSIDGYEQQIAVNHLGHYYLTRLLADKCDRIITVSSRAHRYAPNPINIAIDMMEQAVINPNAMESEYEAWRNYGISKSFNILFARELQRRMSDKGLISVSLHPGVIKSGLQQYLTSDFIKTKTFDKNIEQGTATQIWCALMPNDMIIRGGYYDDCNLHIDRLRDDLKPIDGFFDEGFDATNTLEYKLWEISEKLILRKGFTFSLQKREL